ncbi:sin3 histone deacetylase corepressor complex component SDS3 isoform X1 [Ursus maritimus]|uniref:Sin3 histone deacetylase corepressor complex component SDS3 isoform X1 n=1 Tax=Ursus maritimus TaxID=29073 RepID=A0A8M1EY33_URSMA|nr:sin3 histone deacetylase corepressor complex component SDS3 isoform X1 [Ursus maritimus]
MSAAGLLAPAPAPAGAPPAPEYYPEEDEELESAEDDERSCRGRESDEDTEDASETDLAKHDEEDYVEMKEQMYQDKLASLKRQLQQLQEGTLQEYQKRMKKLDQQYKERIRNAELFLQLETEQVERNYIKEKKAAVKEFEDKKVELKENLIAELEEKKKMIENEKLTMELTGDSMEVKPIMTRKLRRRPNDPVPIPDKRRKPAPAQLNYLLTDEQIMEDLRTLNKLKSPKRPASPSSPEHLPATPAESPAQRFEARIEDGKLYYDKRWYHKSQAIYLESKDNQKLSCVISSVGANEIWVRKTSDSTKMRIYLGQLQRGLFVIRRRKFLTWELLLGLGNWGALLWILRGAVVAATQSSRCSFLPRPLPASRHQELLLWGVSQVRFTHFFIFFFAYTLSFFFFFKLPLSLKGLFFFF